MIINAYYLLRLSVLRKLPQFGRAPKGAEPGTREAKVKGAPRFHKSVDGFLLRARSFDRGCV